MIKNVSFSDAFDQDFIHGAISFEAFADGKRIVCKISDEALQDRFGTNESSLSLFKRYMPEIHSIVGRLIRRYGEVPVSPFYIKTRDIN